MVKTNKGRWTSEENRIFNNSIKLGLTWKQVAQLIGTRTAEQCRSHNQKMKLHLFSKKTNSHIMYFLYRVSKETQYEPQLGFTIDSNTIFEHFDTTGTNEMSYPSLELINLYDEFL